MEIITTKPLKLAVVGHIEWVSFINVDKIPSKGEIGHGQIYKEEPAGGGSVAAVQMSFLTKHKVDFFTALGNDSIGKRCKKRLEELGLNLHIAWRNKPTRKAISLIDKNKDRAITVIGERLQPESKDNLPWDLLKDFDGVFVTAADSKAIKYCREAKILCATPRVNIETLNKANVRLDALIGSSFDPDEQINDADLKVKPKYIISTEGRLGGEVRPGGRYKAIHPTKKEVDSYGCGDSFAAAVTSGIAASWNIEKAIHLGAKCGAECATFFGPYHN